MRIVRFQPRIQWPKSADFQSPDFPAEAARCIPFRNGTSLGLHVFPPFDATVIWRGGCDFEVIAEDVLGELLWMEINRRFHGYNSKWWCSKISGVLQIDPGFAIQTEPGSKILVTGPFNRVSPSYWVHSGLMDTDWFWIPNTINLQMTRIGCPFKLEVHSPIAQLIPVSTSELIPIVEHGEFEDHSEIAIQWRSYLASVYGDNGAGSVHLERITKGVYGRWKCAAEKLSNDRESEQR